MLKKYTKGKPFSSDCTKQIIFPPKTFQVSKRVMKPRGVERIIENGKENNAQRSYGEEKM